MKTAACLVVAAILSAGHALADEGSWDAKWYKVDSKSCGSQSVGIAPGEEYTFKGSGIARLFASNDSCRQVQGGMRVIKSHEDGPDGSYTEISTLEANSTAVRTVCRSADGTVTDSGAARSQNPEETMQLTVVGDRLTLKVTGSPECPDGELSLAMTAQTQ